MAFSDDDDDDDNTSLSTPLLPLSSPPPKPLLSGDSRSTTPPHNSQLSSSYKPLAVLSGHAGSISCLALCGEFVLSASHGRDIIVWQQPDLRQFARFGHHADNNGSVKALAVVGSRVFTAHQDSRIRVWKLSSSSSSDQNLFRLISTLPTTKDYLGKCMNQRNYVQTRRNHRRLWIEHADSISCLAACSNHSTIYSGSWDKTIKVWRVADLKCLESIKAHDDAINALAVYNNVVYSASADGTIKVWEKKEKEKAHHHCLKAVLGRSKDDGNAVAIIMSWNAVIVCNQGRVVYGGGSDGRVMGWETTTDQWSVVCNVRAHETAVLCLCTMGDRFVCTGSADKSIGVWMMVMVNGEVEEERGGGGLWKVRVMKGHEGPVKCLQASWKSGRGIHVVQWRGG